MFITLKISITLMVILINIINPKIYIIINVKVSTFVFKNKIINYFKCMRTENKYNFMRPTNKTSHREARDSVMTEVFYQSIATQTRSHTHTHISDSNPHYLTYSLYLS